MRGKLEFYMSLTKNKLYDSINLKIILKNNGGIYENTE